MKADIAVLIPHYNALDSLEKSLNSISNIEPVDVIIVDDGSKEKPDEQVLKRKFSHINEIKILYLRNNMGIEHALNKGVEYILENNYKYIARLDCGDICYPERFKIQKEFLEKNPDIKLVGSWVSFIDMKTNKELFQFKPPVKHENIKKKMFINNQFIHPSVMFKTEIIKEIGFYPTNRKNAEDYAYFFNIVKNYKVANIPKILLKYEINPQGLSISKRKIQLKNRIKVILDNFDFSFYAFYGLLRNIFIYFLPYSFIEKLKIWLKK
ncbi:glycosyltransferase [Hydrogenothermus marinus]|uniref:Glycosyl transferase family 2 n=1 Tax=Hydrogenothermus marinus TaxID=133270 RepID=A0A3M0BA02_9AQUI|nr:glycosyltransferase [Hydrogenothermus marinus]RMA93304.1 glycosyl transferase family 2 [Hydrogenothermus marinus]